MARTRSTSFEVNLSAIDSCTNSRSIEMHSCRVPRTARSLAALHRARDVRVREHDHRVLAAELHRRAHQLSRLAHMRGRLT